MMPVSPKQLDQCYQHAWNDINDAKECRIQNVQSNINVDISAFYTNLGSSNLHQLEAQIDVMEKVLGQFHIPIRNESSQCMLQ